MYPENLVLCQAGFDGSDEACVAQPPRLGCCHADEMMDRRRGDDLRPVQTPLNPPLARGEARHGRSRELRDLSLNDLTDH